MTTQTETSQPSTGAAPTGGATLVIRALELAKSFGPTQALSSCTFELERGEVHSVMGENGSGKSTLVKILTGVHRQDRGTLEVDGREVGFFRSPRAALDAGIVAVFQEVLIVGARSVADNVWLGMDSLFRHSAPAEERRRRAEAILTELLGYKLDLDVPAEELSLSDRQACCIARALVRSPRILVLDEATSALDISTRDRLFGIVRRLAIEGTSTIFISHRMDEIEEIGDRVTVMRSGETVATKRRGEVSAAELVRLMTGAEHLTGDEYVAEVRPAHDDVVLRATGIRLRASARSIDFDLRAGEIVGLAGLEGQGQDGFLLALRGAGAGTVVRLTSGRSAAISSPFTAARQGIVYVPRERRDEALFATLSIRENFALPTLGRDSTGGFLRHSSSERRLRGYIEKLQIKAGRSGDGITTLSGGNQQKVVIARWLAAEPRILLLNDPTRGVDLGAKRDIYELLVGLAHQGIAVVMLSTELDELVELMDRVLVFKEHELVREIPRSALSRESVVTAYFGREEATDA